MYRLAPKQAECKCGCGLPILKGEMEAVAFPDIQQNGVMMHKTCLDKAFTIGSDVWGKFIPINHQNDSDSENCGGSGFGFHFDIVAETKDTAVDVALRGFTGYYNARTKKYYLHSFKKNAQEASRIAKALSKNPEVLEIKVNGKTAKTADDFHNLMNQAVQNWKEKWEK